MPQPPLRGEGMGRVLRTFRCWPGPISSAVMILVTAGVAAWQWWAVPDDPLEFWFFVLFLMLLLCSALALPGMLERHRVCEHGLVLGYGPTRRARYVVPWSTVDPGRVRVLRRTQLIPRHQGMPASSPHYRIGTGPLAHRSLADGHSAARGMASCVREQEIVVPWSPGPTPLQRGGSSRAPRR